MGPGVATPLATIQPDVLFIVHAGDSAFTTARI